MSELKQKWARDAGIGTSGPVITTKGATTVRVDVSTTKSAWVV